MTVGPEYPTACISYIAGPLRAYSVYTTTSKVSPATGVNTGATPTQVVPTPTSVEAQTSRSTTSMVFTVTSGIAIADPIIVAWQVDDLSHFPTDYAKSLAQMGITEASPITGTGPATTRSEAPSGPGRLNTGAKAGIGVGVAFGLIVLGVILGMLLIRKKRKHMTASNEPNMPEMGDQDIDHASRKWFFGGKWRNEIHADHTQNELDSKTVHVVPGPPAELAGCVPQAHPGYETVATNGDPNNLRR